MVCLNSCHYSIALATHLKTAESKNKLKGYFDLVNPPIMGIYFYSDCDFYTDLSNDILHGNVLSVRSPAIHFKRIIECLFMTLIL